MDQVVSDFENWGPYVMKQFQYMYEKGERCDLEISCEKQIFLVHRLVMSASSEYVRDLGDTDHIILPDEVPTKALKAIINFVYTGKIVFCKEDRDEVLLASDLLKMPVLSELIKADVSGSFILSIDDEEETNKNNEESLDAEMTFQDTEINVLNDPHQSIYTTSPRKSRKNAKNSRPTGHKQTIIPPLFRLPYLQQKFSGSRTYGLITQLTDPIPTRLEIPEEILQNCGYQNTFDDVTYSTEVLFPNLETFPLLESSHHEYLKKVRDSPAYKKPHVNYLFNPTDKYMPPYNASSDLCSRKREIAASYSYSPQTPSPPPKRNPPPIRSVVSCRTPQKATEGRKKSVTFADQLEVVAESPPCKATAKPTEAIEELNAFSGSSNDHEMILPEPLTPVHNITGDIPIDIMELLPVESDDKVELIKLNNVITSTVDNDGDASDGKIISETREQQNDSISAMVVDVDTEKTNDVEIPQPKNDENKSDSVEIMEIEENSPETTDISDENSEVIMEKLVTETLKESSASTIKKNITSAKAVSTSLTKTLSEKKKAKDSNSPSATVTLKQSSDSAVDKNTVPVVEAVSTTPTEEFFEDKAKDSSGGSSSTEAILSKKAILTSINKKDFGNITVSPNSQIFALKMKAPDNPAELDKLVSDLMKKNPMFKDKKVQFKVVPVKGSLATVLKDQKTGKMLTGKNANAIIVKRSAPANSNEKSPSTPKKKKPLPSIENVSGPWECTACVDESEKEVTKFKTYYDFRMHLQKFHKEPENPVYCIHCGYKAQKRNMQVYHLFSKHGVKPAVQFQFPKCDKCDFYALNEYCLHKHATVHSTGCMEYICSCKMSFKTSDLLQKHMVSNDCKNAKCFTCGNCRTTFDRVVNLKAHSRVCNKERPKSVAQTATENGDSVKNTDEKKRDTSKV